MKNLEPYYKLVEEGYLNSQEQGDLVLFNYNDHCTYNKHWNEYTLSARGIIFNKVTGECVARPFPKFFNLSELENKALPQVPENESYEVYNKEDGSLGILYKTPEGKWKVSTRGSFTSPQALKATQMFERCTPLWNANLVAENWTLLFEIIYPENRMQPGARLVTDYGTKETLILLAAVNISTGKDMPRVDLEFIAEKLELPVVKKFNYTIPEMLELKKTLPAMEEGWVIKFESGFRVKIKGDEYLKLHRILNDISPLAIYEKMKDSKEFKLEEDYLKQIPEEILPEVKEIEDKLYRKLASAFLSVAKDYEKLEKQLGTKPTKKDMGIFCQSGQAKYPPAMFTYLDWNVQKTLEILFKGLRPAGNMLE